jgi:hypothetical protein
VWSIEEEAEDEGEEGGISEMGESMVAMAGSSLLSSGALDIPAAKPKKKVRFVLPPAVVADGGGLD